MNFFGLHLQFISTELNDNNNNIFYAFSLKHIRSPPVSNECNDLIGKMLHSDPKKRPSLEAVMKHEWMNKGNEKLESHIGPELHLIDQTLIGMSNIVFFFYINQLIISL